ncbi:MAG: exonuclease SbcCD subunit D [Desulfobulbaceae bacterium]|nr:exonuclease SbcCD subunit D [Desulfobulbaceae bacterium]
MNSKIKILHTADIHIGRTTYGRKDYATGLNTRVMDYQRCLRHVVSQAILEDVDLFLVCGDLYESPHPTQKDQKVLAECLLPLIAAKVPIVIVTGNHDNGNSLENTPPTEIYGILAGVKVVTSPEIFAVETKSGPVQIIGIPWPLPNRLKAVPEYSGYSRGELNNLTVELVRNFVNNSIALSDPEMTLIVAAHLEVDKSISTDGAQRSAESTRDPVFPAGVFIRHEIDYVALGHVHKWQDMNPGAQPPVVYCGSIERGTFNEEGEEKGAVLAEVSKGLAEYTRIVTPARRMVTIDVVVGDEPITVMGEILREVDATDVTDAIVRVRITCTTAQKAEIKIREIKAALAEANCIAGIEITVTDQETRSRAPEVHASAGPLDNLAAYFRSIGMASGEVTRVVGVAGELIGGGEA